MIILLFVNISTSNKKTPVLLVVNTALVNLSYIQWEIRYICIHVLYNKLRIVVYVVV